jgi:protocatechuate 3,4-dioxygenase beta subunit
MHQHQSGHGHDEDHDRGLAHDLRTIERQLIARRRALAWFGGAGLAALLTGCGGGGETASASFADTTSGTTTTNTAASTATTPTTTAATTTASGTCIVDATETNGPYPADGTNTASGATSNVLTYNGIVRSDIRANFVSATSTAAAGVQVTLTLTLVNAKNGCAPLAGYAIYLWHCDASGLYSLYNLPSASYLRGTQVTDGNGQVTFTTIFPGCYSGRFPHFHFEVFSSLAAATTGRAALLVSQIAPPGDVCATVFNNSSLYSASIRNFAAITLANDNVFGDNSAAQNAQMTLAMSGSLSAGYTATNLIGISV